MANITLARRFDEKIALNHELQAILKTETANYGDILSQQSLFFFEDYTNHGILHIEDVLKSTDTLIPDSTFEDVLGSKDITFYILSVLLHDLGMHISYDGFIGIISGAHDENLVSEIDDQTWKELWGDYMAEAKRFSGKQLIEIFGNEEVNISNPLAKNKGQLTNDDRKLIGEFIRRNHPRLAHEIALVGFPGPNGNNISFAEKLTLQERDLIGLIARSHGLSLRKCISYLESKFRNAKRVPLGVHAGYLMILLRISDYLQIDSTRTSKITMKAKTLQSPISLKEHEAHLAIEHVDDKFQDDPERIYVTAAPKDSFMYLKLKKLFESIQFEFDISWAVLGEFYGNLNTKPEIRFRRISSNLDDGSFIKKQEYIGDEFTFKANDEIIKLLIAPLYGNDPKFGARELLQNSVDACNERVLMEASNPKYVPEVVIEIKQVEDEMFFEISDNGSGMNIDEIKNYFLSAGASYRKSREWKEKFVDDFGRSKVQRNGRFGIGVLATFLIGDSFHVTTRSFESEYGYGFSANLNSKQINVVKEHKLGYGTSIKIILTETNFRFFSNLTKQHKSEILWTEWYTLDKPRIIYRVNDKIIKPYKTNDPHYSESNMPDAWHKIDVEGYNKVLWTYSNAFSNREVVCNGLIIPTFGYRRGDIIDMHLISNRPNISVFDNDGVAPISLDRNDLTDSFSFDEELLESIYKDYIAHILTTLEVSVVNENRIVYRTSTFNHRGVNSGKNDSISIDYGEKKYRYDDKFKNRKILKEILISKKGYIPNYNYFLNAIGDSKFIFLQSKSLNTGDIINLDIETSFVLISDEKLNSLNDYKVALIKDNFRNHGFQLAYNEADSFDARVFMKKNRFNFFTGTANNRFPRWLINKFNVVFELDDWIVLEIDKPTDSIIDKEFLLKNSTKLNFLRETKLKCGMDGDRVLDNLLKKYIGLDVIIPYDIEERKKKFPLAFDELRGYMKKYL